MRHEDIQEYSFADAVKVNIYPDLFIDFESISI